MLIDIPLYNGKLGSSQLDPNPRKVGPEMPEPKRNAHAPSECWERGLHGASNSFLGTTSFGSASVDVIEHVGFWLFFPHLPGEGC